MARFSSKTAFLNVPYDDRYRDLYFAFIAGLTAFGLDPRATLEVPGGKRRLDRIFELITSCQYSFHDLSRVQLDRKRPQAPRFNMPFELGVVNRPQTFSPCLRNSSTMVRLCPLSPPPS